MKAEEILIIDDELQIQKLLKITLHANGFRTRFALDGKTGKAAAQNQPPDLILLDLGLPDINGKELLKSLRTWYVKPIIILSVQNSEEEIVLALNSGANDYLVKPFRTGELVARISRALKPIGHDEQPQKYLNKNFEIDFVKRTATRNEETIKLTQIEYKLLVLLCRNEGKVLTHQYLLQEIWGPGHINQTQYLRVFIAQLRKKIEADPNYPKMIVTESGVGYRFVT